MDIGLNLLIPLQGHFCPIKISGDNEEWKNAQKKDKKKKTSDVINNIIPIFNPFKTSLVCRLSNVDSRTTSRHQIAEIIIIIIKLKKNIHLFKLWLNILAVKNTILKSWKDARIGQGLGETRWNGVRIFIVIFLIASIYKSIDIIEVKIQ